MVDGHSSMDILPKTDTWLMRLVLHISEKLRERNAVSMLLANQSAEFKRAISLEVLTGNPVKKR